MGARLRRTRKLHLDLSGATARRNCLLTTAETTKIIDEVYSTPERKTGAQDAEAEGPFAQPGTSWDWIMAPETDPAFIPLDARQTDRLAAQWARRNIMGRPVAAVAGYRDRRGLAVVESAEALALAEAETLPLAAQQCSAMLPAPLAAADLPEDLAEAETLLLADDEFSIPASKQNAVAPPAAAADLPDAFAEAETLLLAEDEFSIRPAGFGLAQPAAADLIFELTEVEALHLAKTEALHLGDSEDDISTDDVSEQEPLGQEQGTHDVQEQGEQGTPEPKRPRLV